MLTIRNYNPQIDYPSIESLCKDSTTFGGQFDEARDSSDRLLKLITEKSNAILVAEESGEIVGTVTLFEDGRSAWLYRFAVRNNFSNAANTLWQKAREILKEKGHTQVLVYGPAGDASFNERYKNLGFNKGNDFTAYWQNI